MWGVDEGLPQATVPAIVQSRDGYLWVGTELGLVRFDGVRFTVFDKGNTPALKSNKIDALLQDHAGNLWIGTIGGGLTQFTNGEFRTFTIQDGLANNSILSLLEDREGNVWIGTEGGGLNRFSGGHFVTYSTKDGLADNVVFALAEGSDGSIWIGSNEGLSRLKKGKFQSYTSKNGLPHPYVRCLFASSEGTLWIGTNGGGLIRFEAGQFRTFTVKDGLPANAIICLREDRRGNLWIGTGGGGLSRFSGGKFSSVTVENGLPSRDVRSIFEDRDANLWVGTAGGGLVRLFGGRTFTSYGFRQGLSDSVALPILEDHEGNLWIGTKDGGLNRFRDGKFTAITTKQGLADNLVFTICEDSEHALWIGTRKGLNRLRNGKLQTYTRKQGLVNDIVLATYSDHEGNVWIGTRGGLSKWTNGVFTNYTTANGLSNNGIRTIFEDSRNRLWIGTAGGGLDLFTNGRFQVFDSRRGLSNDVVLAIHEDAEGVLWIGTDGGGLNRLKDGRFTTYTSKDGLLDDAIFRILEDDSGNLWMSSNKGVFRVSRSALNSFAEGRINRIPTYSYGKADGMATRECNGGFQPAGWRTRDGRLWFPTMRGVVAVDPARLQIAAAPPSVGLDQVLLDGHKRDVKGEARVRPGRGDLEFRYSAPNFRSPQKVTFRYKLDGFDRDWIDAGSRRTAYYTNIPPGHYKFQVIASNGDGVYSTRAATLDLILAPHFYQTFWLYGLGGLMIIGLAWGSHVVHVHRLRERREILESCVEERTAKLRNEIAERERAELELVSAKEAAERASSVKSEFLANMSHEIRTPMNAILGMAELALTAKAEPERKKCLEIVKSSGDYLLTIINDVLDFSKVEAGKLDLILRDFELREALAETVESIAARAREKGIALRCELDSNAPEVIHADPVRLRQILWNLVGNAIKFSQHGTIFVRVKCEARHVTSAMLHFAVRDNGIGIPQEKLGTIFEAFTQADSSITKGFGGTGLGLAICSRLVRLMGGKIWAESEIGKGSEFHFTARVGLASKPARIAPPESVAASNMPLSAASTRTADFNILIAEDNPSNRMLARLALERAGFRITEVENGLEALQVVSRFSFDVVLMDCRMPIMDGYTATARIRQMGGKTGQIPIVALTASAFKEDRSAAEQAGMDDFLSKPFQPSELVSKCVAWAKASRHFSTSMGVNEPRTASDKTSEEYSESFIREVFAIFVETSPPVFDNLTRAIEEEDWPQAQHCAHWLRSGAVRMLSPVLERQLGDIESTCRSSPPFVTREDLASLKISFQSARNRAELWCSNRLSSSTSA